MTTFAKIGSSKIEVPAEFQNNIDMVREMLKTSHPEVKNATVRTKTEDDHTVIEFLASPGRKG